MFELLGMSLLLAGLLIFNSIASLLTSASWQLAAHFSDRWTAQTRARLLFLLRTLPALVAVACVLFLVVPSYLVYEPRHTSEIVSFKLGLLAFLSATGIAFSLARAIAASRATARLTADWLEKAEPITIAGLTITAYRIDHAFPVIAIVGIWRPRLFVARQIFDLLSEEEIAAAVAHENGHLRARDNLKRGLMRACRDALLIVPLGRSLDRAWAKVSEEAADENAAQQDVTLALDLASALVKIARNIPQGIRPTMPAGVFLLGEEDEPNGIKYRVGRLVELAASGRRPEMSPGFIGNPTLWCAAGFSFLILALAVDAHSILSTVHTLIEHAVYLLT